MRKGNFASWNWWSDLADQKNHKSAKTSILSGLFLNTQTVREERERTSTTDAGYESLRIFNTCKSDFLWRPFCLVILHNGLMIHQNYNLDNNFKLNSWIEKRPSSWTFSKILRNILQFLLTFDPVWFTRNRLCSKAECEKKEQICHGSSWDMTIGPLFLFEERRLLSTHDLSHFFSNWQIGLVWT